MARCRSNNSSPQANDLCAPPTSSDYYIDVDSNGNWDAADINAAWEPLEYTVLKKTFEEVPETCRRVDVAVPLYMIGVICFVIGLVSAVNAGDKSFNDALRHIAEVSEL